MRSFGRVALVIGCLIGGMASAQPSSSTAGDVLADELQRCKALREAAAADARCLAAYKHSREQFFAPGKPYEPHAVDMFPRTPDRPLTAPRTDDSAGRP